MDTTGKYDDDVRTDDLLRTGDERDVRTSAGSGYAGAGYAGNDTATTVAAVFADHERAHDAIHQLHSDGFRETWIGRTKYDDTARYDDDAVGTSAGARPSGAFDAAGMADDSGTFGERRTAGAPVYGETPAVYGDAASGGDTRVEADNWFMRLFGEGDESLHDALVRHGVSEADARSAGSLPPHSAIVTVDGANHPELAAQILSEAGGRVITSGLGQTGYGTTGRYAYDANLDAGRAPGYATTAGFASGSTMSSPGSTDVDTLRGDTGRDLAGTGTAPAAAASADFAADRAAAVRAGAGGSETIDDTDPDFAMASDAARYPDATGYDDYGKYRAGVPVDESTRLQLREERLRVDKSRVSRGEATVGTDVVTEAQEFDVPVMREELFIERRPAGRMAQSGTDANAPIGSGDVIRVPLTEERVSVTKVPVVTEEVIVGKRDVQGTEHISETTRKEQLNVADVESVRVGDRVR